MADIAFSQIHDSCIRIHKCHIFFIDHKTAVCLMMISVVRLIHFVAGVDIKFAVCFCHAETASIKWNVGVGSFNTALCKAIPVFIIFHETEYFTLIRFFFVHLSKNCIIIIFANIDPTKNRKFCRNIFRRNQIQFAVVSLNHDLIIDIFCTLISAVCCLCQIRLRGTSIIRRIMRQMNVVGCCSLQVYL